MQDYYYLFCQSQCLIKWIKSLSWEENTELIYSVYLECKLFSTVFVEYFQHSAVYPHPEDLT